MDNSIIAERLREHARQLDSGRRQFSACASLSPGGRDDRRTRRALDGQYWNAGRSARLTGVTAHRDIHRRAIESLIRTGAMPPRQTRSDANPAELPTKQCDADAFRQLLEMIRFSHTLFALPFALLSAVLAWRSKEGFSWLDLVGILFAWFSPAAPRWRLTAWPIDISTRSIPAPPIAICHRDS